MDLIAVRTNLSTKLLQNIVKPAVKTKLSMAIFQRKY